MASIPTPQQVADAQAITKQIEEEKRQQQQAEGKDFVNHGQGVMSEAEWQQHKPEENSNG